MRQKSLKKKEKTKLWIQKWFDGVSDGSNTMSQRSLNNIRKNTGSITQLTREAKQRRIHLLLLEDDRGEKIVAASLKRFKILA